MQNSQNSTYAKLNNLIEIEGLTSSLAAHASTCAASNHPIAISVIANKYLEILETKDEKIYWIEYVRSGIVKGSLIYGIPRAINAQDALFNGIPKEYQKLLRKTSVINQKEDNWDLYGSKFLHLVYGTKYDDTAYILNSAETTYLNYVDTELSTVVGLIQMDTLPQLKSHLKGAKNVGATAEQIKAAKIIGWSVKDAFK